MAFTGELNQEDVDLLRLPLGALIGDVILEYLSLNVSSIGERKQEFLRIMAKELADLASMEELRKKIQNLRGKNGSLDEGRTQHVLNWVQHVAGASENIEISWPAFLGFLRSFIIKPKEDTDIHQRIGGCEEARNCFDDLRGFDLNGENPLQRLGEILQRLKEYYPYGQMSQTRGFHHFLDIFLPAFDSIQKKILEELKRRQEELARRRQIEDLQKQIEDFQRQITEGKQEFEEDRQMQEADIEELRRRQGETEEREASLQRYTKFVGTLIAKQQEQMGEMVDRMDSVENQVSDLQDGQDLLAIRVDLVEEGQRNLESVRRNLERIESDPLSQRMFVAMYEIIRRFAFLVQGSDIFARDRIDWPAVVEGSFSIIPIVGDMVGGIIEGCMNAVILVKELRENARFKQILTLFPTEGGFGPEGKLMQSILIDLVLALCDRERANLRAALEALRPEEINQLVAFLGQSITKTITDLALGEEIIKPASLQYFMMERIYLNLEEALQQHLPEISVLVVHCQEEKFKATREKERVGEVDSALEGAQDVDQLNEEIKRLINRVLQLSDSGPRKYRGFWEGELRGEGEKVRSNGDISQSVIRAGGLRFRT